MKLTKYLSTYLILLFLAAITWKSATAQDYAEQNIMMPVSEDLNISAIYYSIPGERGPSLMLINEPGTSVGWKPYLSLLQKAGVKSILTIDLPGKDESEAKDSEEYPDSTKIVNWKEFSRGDYLNIAEDLEIAWDYLKGTASTDTSQMGIIGASLAANYAAIFASEHPEIKSLVMLSPGIVYRGVGCMDAVKSYGKRAVLFAASRDDTYSAGSCEELQKISEGTPAHIEIYPGEARGIKLLDGNPEFEHFLSDWFLSTL